MLRSVVLGCGSYLPGRVLTNDDLARMVDTSVAAPVPAYAAGAAAEPMRAGNAKTTKR